MAFPVILIDSATGSDSTASGAGPAVSLHGVAGSADGADSIDLTTDAPDLSGVAVDGTAVIYIASATAGDGNFFQITSINSKVVTFETVSGLPNTVPSGTFSWAIGGKRASWGSSTSKKLTENNSAKGDGLPGWTIEFQSAHTETIAATMTMQRTNAGGIAPITIRGTSGAAVKPILVFSNTGTAIAFANASIGFVFKNFTMQNSSGNTSSSIAFGGAATTATFKMLGVDIKDATNFFWKGVSFSSTTAVYMDGCEIANCNSMGVDFSAATNNGIVIRHCVIHNNGSHGVESATGDFYDNRIYSNTGDGLHLIKTGNAANFTNSIKIIENTITGNGGDAVEVTSTPSQTAPLTGMVIESNVLTANTGYALNFSGALMSDVILASFYSSISGNVLSGNSGASNSGKYNIDLSTIVSAASSNQNSGTSSGATAFIGTSEGII